VGVSYATERDLYRYGLPRGTIGTAARVVASALADTDTIELEAHGLVDDDAVLVRATEGGTIAEPLEAGTTYYVKRVTDSTFQLAATEGGAAIDLTADGESMLVSVALDVDAVLERYSRFVDDFIPAHAVPLEVPYPIEIVATVCELAARRLQILSGTTSESMAQQEIAAKAQLERWASGLAHRDVATRTNLAVTLGASSASAARTVP
jgi:hypothetical protein